MSVGQLLGLDVGTSAIKALVIDDRGQELGRARARTPWRTVSTGAEMSPTALLMSAVVAATNALEQAPRGLVCGVGVASMAETGVLLDRHGCPVVPAIAWHDSRGTEQARRLATDLDAESFSARTGLPASSLCTLAKYAWLREHRPASGRGVRWLNIAEWIVRGFGGEEAAELSLASRTGFYDLQSGAPWDDALNWAEAPAGLMPTAVPAGSAVGTVSTALFAEARDAVLAVGGHDHLSAAVGAGATGEGDVLNSCGTVEAFVRATAPLNPEAVSQSVTRGITVGWHVVEGRQALLGTVPSGSCIQRLVAELGVRAEERSELEAAALAADLDLATADDLMNPETILASARRGANPGTLYRAALEVFGAAGAKVLADMTEVAGPRRRLVVTGGWGTGEAARAVKRRHLGAFQHSGDAVFTGAAGAALAAGSALGWWSVSDAPRIKPGLEEPVILRGQVLHSS